MCFCDRPLGYACLGATRTVHVLENLLAYRANMAQSRVNQSWTNLSKLNNINRQAVLKAAQVS